MDSLTQQQRDQARADWTGDWTTLSPERYEAMYRQRSHDLVVQRERARIEAERERIGRATISAAERAVLLPNVLQLANEKVAASGALTRWASGRAQAGECATISIEDLDTKHEVCYTHRVWADYGHYRAIHPSEYTGD